MEVIERRALPRRIRHKPDYSDRKLPGLPVASEMKRMVFDEMQKWLDIMQATWAFKPNIEVKTYIGFFSNSECLVVKCDFNIVGFQHKGRKHFIRPSSIERRNPRQIAKTTMAEIIDHRNTCVDCGRGLAGLHERLLGPTSIDMENHAWEGYRRMAKLENQTGFREATDKNEEGKRLTLYRDLMAEPDAVEIAMYPKVCAKITEKLASPESQAIINSPARAKLIEILDKRGCILPRRKLPIKLA